eukprot:s26_g71.t1
MEEKALWQYTRFVYANQVDTYTFDQLLSGIAERIEEQWQISVSPDDLEIRYDENHGLEVFQVTSDQPYWNLRNLLDQYRPQWQTHQFSASRDLMVSETNLETGRLREHQVEFFFFKLVGDWPTAQRMGNYRRQHYRLETFPITTVPDSPPTTPAASGTATLDPAMVSVVRLMTEIHNLPPAPSLAQSQSQLLAMVRDSDVLTEFNTVQLNTLAAQIHQLADLVAAAHSSPLETPHPMEVHSTSDVHLTAADHDDL